MNLVHLEEESIKIQKICEFIDSVQLIEHDETQSTCTTITRLESESYFTSSEDDGQRYSDETENLSLPIFSLGNLTKDSMTGSSCFSQFTRRSDQRKKRRQLKLLHFTNNPNSPRTVLEC
jgi:hypothetical protein